MKKLVYIALRYLWKNPGNWSYPWCAAFLNMVLTKADLPTTHSLLARSFLKWGVSVDKPRLGDIVVLWRESPSSWKGHAGLYIAQYKSHVILLGGNQDGTTKLKSYPKHRILSIRRTHEPITNKSFTYSGA